MECNHPEAYVSIIGPYRVCNKCGEKLPLKAPEKPAAPKKGGKKDARN